MVSRLAFGSKKWNTVESHRKGAPLSLSPPLPPPPPPSSLLPQKKASSQSALASLILAASSSHHGVSGQIIFIPTMTRSNFPDPLTSVSSLSYYQDEPPCRTRRLEPFQQRVREECPVDAMVHCHQGGGTANDLVRSLMLPVSSPTGHDEQRMESLLDAIFAPSQSAGKYVDPLDRISKEIMNFPSLLSMQHRSPPLPPPLPP